MTERLFTLEKTAQEVAREIAAAKAGDNSQPFDEGYLVTGRVFVPEGDQEEALPLDLTDGSLPLIDVPEIISQFAVPELTRRGRLLIAVVSNPAVLQMIEFQAAKDEYQLGSAAVEVWRKVALFNRNVRRKRTPVAVYDSTGRIK